MKSNIHISISIAFFIAGMVSPHITVSCDDFKKLHTQFVEPSKEYKPAPLYVWNTHINEELLERTMKGLREQEFGGVFVHPRPGLVTEYLSDEWFSLFRYTLDKGKELDMNVWIYDENTFPSGFAGGHVNAEMPESYNQGGSIVLYRYEMLPEKIDNLYLCLKEVNGEFMDITKQLDNEKGRKGKYYVYIKSFEPRVAWHGGYSYVDLLQKGVTQKFLEVTGTGYERVAKEEFGKSLPGWFTDEPHIGPPGGGIRWTPDLFSVFQDRWGYDLKTWLPALSMDVGPWKQIRHDYYQTLLELFIERWAKPCYEYCEQHNLKFTGHYWEHAWPEIVYGPDNMAMYAWQHMPGIDMLMNQFNENEPQAQFGNVRSVKEVRSAANQLGRKRILCETYGASGWEETFRDFKRLGDWQSALGVNFMNQHLSHLSLAGDRKYDCPPSFSDHSPWWAHYKILNRHFARLSAALSMGEQFNDILVLEPTTTLWQYYVTWDSRPQLWEIGRNFQCFVTTLEKAQSEYDLGSEQVIYDHGRIHNGSFEVGQRAYSTVVIPPLMENLNTKTFELLKEFAAQGGKIVSFSVPSLVDGRESEELHSFFTKHPSIIREPELTPEVINEHLMSSAFRPAGFTGGNIFHQRREYRDGQLLFLVNSSIDEISTGSIHMQGCDAIELNTLTGDITDYPEKRISKDSLHVDFKIYPGGSLLLYIFDKPQHKYKKACNFVNLSPVKTNGELTIQPTGCNVLSVDFCDLELGNEYFKDIHVYEADQLIFKHYGFPEGNPWGTAIQYKDNIISRDTMTCGGFSAAYHFSVDDKIDFQTLNAIVERPQLYTIKVNGKLISNYSAKWWVDRDFRVLPIGEFVHSGDNIITISIHPMQLAAELAPIYILGDFALQSAPKGWTLVPQKEKLQLGSWKKQGWPFYSRAVVYEQKFDLATPGSYYEVRLGKWDGTVAEITVNGEAAGIIAFEPYVLDVSKWIRSGKNTIEVKVIGSNKNLFGPFHNESSIGFVTPNLYKGTAQWPAGQNYLQLDYGLYEPFILVSGY